MHLLVYMYVCICIYQVFVYLYLSIYLCTAPFRLHLFACLSVCLTAVRSSGRFVYPSIIQSCDLSICPSAHPCLYLSTCLSASLYPISLLLSSLFAFPLSLYQCGLHLFETLCLCICATMCFGIIIHLSLYHCVDLSMYHHLFIHLS